ncbi:MAG: hypothetical protein QOD60_1748 [Solirubrobacterales bacterium]|nr:hypothetical protein [Solirubrobacterales bacterium]
MEPDGDFVGKPLQRQLAVSRLAARILSDGVDPRAEPIDQPVALVVAQDLGRDDVEDRLDPRRRDIRVLAAGARGAARAQLDLRQRNREIVVDFQLVGRSAPLTSRKATKTSSAENESSRVRWLTAFETSTPIRTPIGDSKPITIPSRNRTLP